MSERQGTGMDILRLISEAGMRGIRTEQIGGGCIEVYGVSYDSRRVAKGDIFICKGEDFKYNYLIQAQKRGAAVTVMSRERALRTEIGEFPMVVTENDDDTLKFMAVCSAALNGYPTERLKTVCVTGTKGKSTVCALIKSILTEAGKKCALVGEILPSGSSRLTTPESSDLHAAAKTAVDNGYEYLVCEVSSQAQKLYRTYGIRPYIACFTNFGRDHIGPLEHSGMEDYFLCKASLFENAELSVINIGDRYGKRLYGMLGEKRKKGFSLRGKNAELYCTKLNIGSYGCDFSIKEKGGVTFKAVTDGGLYSVENAVCAAAVCRSLGVSAEAIKAGVLKCRVAGRGELYESIDGKCTVTVDYAHNEMSFRAVLENARSRFPGAAVTVIFGCPGDKAQCRRNGLANVCAELADRVIFCDDDGGNEGYDSIKKEMQTHFAKAVSEDSARLSELRISYIESRETAIIHAIELASESGEKNAIFMLGKGAEDKNRGCGCDRTCETDATLVKRALAYYDASHGIKQMLGGIDDSNGCILVALEDKGKLRALLCSVSLLLRKGVRIIAVCSEEVTKEIEEAAFSEGVMADVRSYTSLKKKDVEEISGEMKIGIMPFITVKREIYTALFRISKMFSAEKAVYITEKTAMINVKDVNNGKISLRALKTVREFGFEGYYEPARAIILGGASEVAVINGRSSYSLTAYLCGGRCDGLLISAV